MKNQDLEKKSLDWDGEMIECDLMLLAKALEIAHG